MWNIVKMKTNWKKNEKKKFQVETIPSIYGFLFDSNHIRFEHNKNPKVHFESILTVKLIKWRCFELYRMFSLVNEHIFFVYLTRSSLTYFRIFVSCSSIWLYPTNTNVILVSSVLASQNKCNWMHVMESKWIWWSYRYNNLYENPTNTHLSIFFSFVSSLLLLLLNLMFLIGCKWCLLCAGIACPENNKYSLFIL